MGKIINNDYTFLNYALALFFLASPIESIALSEGFSIAKFSALMVLLGWATQGFKTKQSLMIRSCDAGYICFFDNIMVYRKV